MLRTVPCPDDELHLVDLVRGSKRPIARVGVVAARAERIFAERQPVQSVHGAHPRRGLVEEHLPVLRVRRLVKAKLTMLRHGSGEQPQYVLAVEDGPERDREVTELGDGVMCQAR